MAAKVGVVPKLLLLLYSIAIGFTSGYMVNSPTSSKHTGNDDLESELSMHPLEKVSYIYNSVPEINIIVDKTIFKQPKIEHNFLNSGAPHKQGKQKNPEDPNRSQNLVPDSRIETKGSSGGPNKKSESIIDEKDGSVHRHSDDYDDVRPYRSKYIRVRRAPPNKAKKPATGPAAIPTDNEKDSKGSTAISESKTGAAESTALSRIGDAKARSKGGTSAVSKALTSGHNSKAVAHSETGNGGDAKAQSIAKGNSNNGEIDESQSGAGTQNGKAYATATSKGSSTRSSSHASHNTVQESETAHESSSFAASSARTSSDGSGKPGSSKTMAHAVAGSRSKSSGTNKNIANSVAHAESHSSPHSSNGGEKEVESVDTEKTNLANEDGTIAGNSKPNTGHGPTSHANHATIPKPNSAAIPKGNPAPIPKTGAATKPKTNNAPATPKINTPTNSKPVTTEDREKPDNQSSTKSNASIKKVTSKPTDVKHENHAAKFMDTKNDKVVSSHDLNSHTQHENHAENRLDKNSKTAGGTSTGGQPGTRSHAQQNNHAEKISDKNRNNGGSNLGRSLSNTNTQANGNSKSKQISSPSRTVGTTKGTATSAQAGGSRSDIDAKNGGKTRAHTGSSDDSWAGGMVADFLNSSNSSTSASKGTSKPSGIWAKSKNQTNQTKGKGASASTGETSASTGLSKDGNSHATASTGNGDKSKNKESLEVEDVDSIEFD